MVSMATEVDKKACTERTLKGVKSGLVAPLKHQGLVDGARPQLQSVRNASRQSGCSKSLTVALPFCL